MDDPHRHYWPDADQPDEEDEDLLSDRYLTFSLDSDAYGIEIRHVLEIVVLQPITEVPDLPAYVRGVINLRGQVLPVIDLHRRFNLAERPYDERTCVIVTELRGMSIGLIVDQVDDVVTIFPTEISPAPRLSRGPTARCLYGVGRADDGVKLLLSADELVFGDDVEHLAQVSPDAITKRDEA